VVVGISHPLQHLHGKAIGALRQGGATVEVGGQNLLESGSIQVRYVASPLLELLQGVVEVWDSSKLVCCYLLLFTTGME